MGSFQIRCMYTWGVSLFKEESDRGDAPWLNSFMLTKNQSEYLLLLSERIAVATDEETGIITGSVKMQDPLISATLMEIVLENLQKHITDYRTRKAKRDLTFTEKMYSEAKANYFLAQQSYARYVDENKNVVSASFQTENQRLLNEMELTYGVYNQMAQQLETNKIKVQEQTPVYTIIEPSTVPLNATSPNKPLIIIGFFFLGGFLCVAKLCFRDILQKYLIKDV